MKTQSSELHQDKTELKATLDFVTNENGELNEKLLELTTKLEKIESEKNELKNSADNEFNRRKLCEKNFQKLEKKYESVKSSNEKMVKNESIWKIRPVPPLELSLKPHQAPQSHQNPPKPRPMAPPPLQASSHTFKMPDRQQKPNRSSDKENVMLPPNDFNPACGSMQTQQSQQVYQKNIRDQSNERFESRHSFRKEFDKARHNYAKKYGPLVNEKGTREMIIKDMRDVKFQGKPYINGINITGVLFRNLQYAT